MTRCSSGAESQAFNMIQAWYHSETSQFRHTQRFFKHCCLQALDSVQCFNSYEFPGWLIALTRLFVLSVSLTLSVQKHTCSHGGKIENKDSSFLFQADITDGTCFHVTVFFNMKMKVIWSGLCQLVLTWLGYTAEQCFDEKFFQTKSLMIGVI